MAITVSVTENAVTVTPDENTVTIQYPGPKGDTGATGEGVPSEGTTGQILIKSSNTDYDTEWASLSGMTEGVTSAITTGIYAKDQPVDADWVPIIDSEASSIFKKWTFAKVKAALKSYFDTLYGAGDVTGPASSTANNLASFSDVTGKVIKDAGTPATVVNSAIVTGIQNKDTPIDADWVTVMDSEASNGFKKWTLAKIKAVLKTYFDGLYGSGDGDVAGPASSTDGNVALFNGLTGKIIKDGGTPASVVNSAIVTGIQNKDTPVDADFVVVVDTEATNAFKKWTLAKIKTVLKSYFDTIYGAGGDVTGPSSSTDGNFALFNGVTGKAIKDGGTPATVVNSAIVTGIKTKDHPINADWFPIIDTEASNVFKKLTVEKLNALLKGVPTITLGDAGKVVAVKSDETGYELVTAPEGGGGGVGDVLYLYQRVTGGF